MNNRLIGLSVGAILLLVASVATMVSPLLLHESTFSYLELCICAAIPAFFSMTVALTALNDIFPTLYFQQYRTKRRLQKIRRAFDRSSQDTPADWDSLEQLIEEKSNLREFHKFIRRLESPLRVYNYDCIQSETYRDIEVAAICCLSRVLQLIQSSSDPYAHLQSYLDEQVDGKLDEETAYKHHISYSVEESLARAIIYMLKAVDKCGLLPKATRWPVYIGCYKYGDLSKNVKMILGWIASFQGAEDDRLAELYITAIYNLVAICKAEHIPISFYVAKVLERGQ